MKRKLSWWICGACLSALIFLIEIAVLVRGGGVTFDHSERRYALLALLPFYCLWFFLAVGFWRATRTARSTLDRYLRWTVLMTHVFVIGSIGVAIALFVMSD